MRTQPRLRTRASAASAVVVLALVSSCGGPSSSLDDPGAPAFPSSRETSARSLDAVARSHGIPTGRYSEGDEGEARLKDDLLNGFVSSADRPDAYRTTETDSIGTAELPLPLHPEYEALRAWLGIYRDIADAGGWPSVAPAADHLLEPGDRHPAVAILRTRMVASPEPVEAELAGTGRTSSTDAYDPELVLAVQAFQARVGLDPDGVVGPATWAALAVPASRRVGQLEQALEWFRWLPRDFGLEFTLWVNLPTFELQAVEQFASLLEMPVVVGAVRTPTPPLVDTLRTVVVNPFWHVPSSIALGEIAPAQASNPNHLAEGAYEVIGRDGSVVDPSVLDWSDTDSWAGGYRIRQRPGPGNALGEVKFLFPNQQAIYMHDTPSKGTFERAFRAASHGCVRLSDPWALAHLLGREGVLADDVETARGGPSPRSYDVSRGVPVYFTYLPARADSRSAAPRFAPALYPELERLMSAQPDV